MADNRKLSECSRIGACEPFSTSWSIITNNAYHFIELWAYLDAASKSTVRSLGLVCSQHSCLFERQSGIAFLIPRVGNDNRALGAWDTCRIKINRNLVRLQLIVATVAIRKDAWNIVSLNYIKKAFSRECSDPSWNAIRRNNVDPDNLFWNLYSSLNFFLVMTMSTSEWILRSQRCYDLLWSSQ